MTLTIGKYYSLAVKHTIYYQNGFSSKQCIGMWNGHYFDVHTCYADFIGEPITKIEGAEKEEKNSQGNKVAEKQPQAQPSRLFRFCYVKMKIYLKTYYGPIWEWREASGIYTLAPFRKGQPAPLRYFVQDDGLPQLPLYDDELHHIERIVNGFEPESGALLYLDHESELVRKLAQVIVNQGRKEVLILYTDNKNLAYHRDGRSTEHPLRGYPHDIKEMETVIKPAQRREFDRQQKELQKVVLEGPSLTK